VIPWLHGFDSFADFFLEQTALVGQVSEEFNFLPVENEELRRISEKAAVEAMKPKEKVQYIDDISPDITNAAILLPSNKGHFVVSFRSFQSVCIFIC
jgi:transcription initiation factor TFIIF subunit beta